jgi:NAD dependent epimerase/dehydratase family enzyme
MLLPFKLGLGGPMGNGRNWMSWIGIDDLVAVLTLALQEERVEGALNAVTAQPERFTDFAKTLGRVLSRPAFLPLPAFLAKLALGEMAEALLLASTRVRPARLEALEFPFEHASLEAALRHLLGRPSSAFPGSK